MNSLSSYYIEKIKSLKPRIILLNGPFLWAQAPSYTLSVIDSYFREKNLSSFPLDLNFLLYSHYPHLRKNWTFSNVYKQEKILNDLFKDDFFSPILKILKSDFIDYLGFSISKNNEKFMIKFIEKLREYTGKKIILGGPQIFFNYCLKNYNYFNIADKIVIGEIESSEIDIENSQKIFLANNNSKLIIPDFKNFPLTLYPRKRHLPLMITRGCICKCAFCSERLIFGKYRKIDLKIVEEKIKEYKKNYNIFWITFFDSLIDGDLEYLYKLAEILKKLEIKWEAQFLIRKDITEKLLLKLKESGCFNLFIGMESASDKILEKMNKPFRKKDIINFLKLAKKVNLHFEISLIFGYPYEQEKDFEETCKFIEEYKEYIPKIAQINPFIFYPCTEIAKEFPHYKLYETYLDAEKATLRINRVLKLINSLKIPYTESYINNLTTFTKNNK